MRTIAEDALQPATAEYDAFATIYNRWIAADFCRRAFPVVERLLLSRLPSNAHILDVCCGSGQFASALNARGYSVTGIDNSAKMLDHAKRNAPGVHFVEADIRKLELLSQYDAAISTFNSLAHVKTIGELTTVFTNVHHALRPGAPVLFDLSMEEAYSSKWRGAFTLVAEDHVCVIRPSYDAANRLGTNHITMFQSQAGVTQHISPTHNSYTRSDFAITQTCHSENDIREALAAADFLDVAAYEAERDLEMAGESGRTFFLCH